MAANIFIELAPRQAAMFAFQSVYLCVCLPPPPWQEATKYQSHNLKGRFINYTYRYKSKRLVVVIKMHLVLLRLEVRVRKNQHEFF